MNQYSELARKYSTQSASRNHFIWRRLMLASVSALAVSTASNQVMAQCEPNPAEDGDAVICDNVEPTDVEVLASDVSVIVEQNALVRSIRIIGERNTFENRGDAGFVSLSGIFGSIPETNSTTGINNGNIASLSLSRGVLSFENQEDGTIISEGVSSAVSLDNLFNGTLINSGVIRSESTPAVDTFSSSTRGIPNNIITIINTETGLIESTERRAISGVGLAIVDITNFGTIRGGQFSTIQLGEGSILRNQSSGIVTGNERSVAVEAASADPLQPASIINRGNIWSPDLAILGTGFYVENFGKIVGKIDTDGFLLGSETIRNFGEIEGQISLGLDSDYIENSGTIEGNILLGGGNDRIENRNTIIGDSLLGDGDDTFINAGLYDGNIDLGAGNDLFFVDVDSYFPNIVSDVRGGEGVDTFGVFTSSNDSFSFSDIGDFEIAAAFADGPESFLEILNSQNTLINSLQIYGTGTVANNQSIDGTGALFTDVGIELVTDGVSAINYALVESRTAVRLSGNNQTFTNDANLTDGLLTSGSTGNTGYVVDAGIGNTIINDGQVSINTSSLSAVFIGDSVFTPGDRLNSFLSNNIVLPTTTVINNGILQGNSGAGLRTSTQLPVHVSNYGFIDKAVAELSFGEFFVENNAGGEVGFIAISEDFFEPDYLVSQPSLFASIVNRENGFISGFSSSDATIAIIVDALIDPRVDAIDIQITNEKNAEIKSAIGSAIFANRNGVTSGGMITVDVDINLEIFNSGKIYSGGESATIGISDGFAISPDLTDVLSVDTSILNEGIIENRSVNIGDTDSAVAIELGYGSDVVRNIGTIIGDVHLGGGDDTFIVVGDSRVDGIVSAGENIPPPFIEESDVDDLDILSFTEFFGNVVANDFLEFEQIEISTNGTAVIGGNAGLSESITDLIAREGLTLLETDLMLDATILENGILGGNGSILGNVTNYGTIAPGASIGDLTINGDLTLAANSVLSIEFDDSASDVLTVMGEVSIDEATLEFTSLGANLSSIHSFEFLTANSVSGQFSDISFNGFTGFADLVFANGVLGVTITPQFELSPSLTANSVSVAGYLNDLIVADAVNTSAENIVSTLFSLSANDTALNAAMLSLQPEAFAATAAISVENAFLINDMIRDRARIEIYREDGKYFWLSGAGGFANYEGDLGGDGTSSFKTNSRGIIGGAEIVRGDALIGIYGGTVESDQELRTGLSQTEADGFVTGGYGAWRIGKISNTASFGYVFGDAETDRVVPALLEQMRTDYDFDSFTAQGRSQYDFTVNGLLLSPFAGATYVRSERGTIVESGGASALHVSDQSESFLFLDVGSAIEKQFSINDRTKARAAFTAGWRYEALGHSIDAYSSIGMDGPFNLAGAAADFDRSRLVVGGDGSIDVGENISVFAKYRGEFGGNYTSNRISGGLTIKF